MPNHHHRAGSLRQTNKANKRSNASKRSTGRQGRLSNNKKSTLSNLMSLSKADRRNQAKLKRDEKRKKLLNEKRSDVPRVVGIVNLTDASSTLIPSKLCELSVNVQTTKREIITTQFRTHKLTFLSASTVPDALDMARVCDILVLEVNGNYEGSDPSNMLIGASSDSTTAATITTSKFDVLIRENAHDVLQALKAQGLPTPLTVLTYDPPTEIGDNDAMTFQSAKSSRRHELHRHQGLRKYIQRFSTTEFGDKAKVAEWNPSSEASTQNLIRTMTTMSCRPASWIADTPRSYVLVEDLSHRDDELEISGYVRGGVLDVHALFHIPHVGTFAARAVKRGNGQVVVADPTLRESLDRFATPNALDGEQNLIGFDDDDDDGKDDDAEMNKERPAGWSNYQNAWFDAIDGDEHEEGDLDHGELADELNTKQSQITDDDAMLDDDDEDLVAAKAVMNQERRKQYKDDAEFPDEVQVPDDVNARDRFQRYRALKNFRKSTWDPKENLPATFANIFHFKNFSQTQKVVMKDLKEVEKAAVASGNRFFGASNSDEMKDDDEEDILEGCVPCGTFVTVCLEKVSAEDLKRIHSTSVLAVVSLLPHENKVSVLNVGLKHCNPGCEPIKSKDVLTFHCGWRTWNARPVFSQHNLNSDKHKLERFLPDQNAHICASIFGPVTYTPCPVLVFRGKELVAIGSMLGANADRIVVKRILLTGFPVKVRKRTAVVKYMFYNPEDVKWFKPAGLYTKHGLSGHITQSVGEHGTMKCLFNAPIHQHDTVCLPLYKRIFPKYAPNDYGEITLEVQ